MTDKHIIHITASVTDALAKLNALSGGVMTLVVEDGRGRVAGTVTDGDIRRVMESRQAEFFNIRAIDIATRSPKTIGQQVAVHHHRVV